ncbi:MAG: formamidopyrimidine-DNA glycosylase [Acidimicrobiia bacterium]|nr:formamidopyrimidine-DNA glycosylase [Acidimicrobiia bacterium]
MPEILEVETYRRAAERALGRRVAAVRADDDWYLKGGLEASELHSALGGARFVAARRRGKLLLLDVDAGAVLGLRFGMTGRLLVDDGAAIDRLEYSSDRDDPAWDRFGLTFDDGGSMVLRDPRRLGGVELDPDEGALGPDAWTIGPATLRDVLAGSTAPLKTRLMDQARLAGMGNLLTDETLWRAGLAPTRDAGSLDARELRRLHRNLRRVLNDLDERGGSHTGDLQASRQRGATCPRDGSPLRREAVGGRTTYWCPAHQR